MTASPMRRADKDAVEQLIKFQRALRDAKDNLQSASTVPLGLGPLCATTSTRNEEGVCVSPDKSQEIMELQESVTQGKASRKTARKGERAEDALTTSIRGRRSFKKSGCQAEKICKSEERCRKKCFKCVNLKFQKLNFKKPI